MGTNLAPRHTYPHEPSPPPRYLRMKRRASPILLVLVVAGALSCGTASATANAMTKPLGTKMLVTFRLHVSGDIPQAMTFWLAYGPLGGRFGIVRLHRSRVGLYAASVRLPVGRSSFAFVAGYGVIHVRFGPAPGNPVITIRRIDRCTALQAARIGVYWHVPEG
jgi:hypothetical protein